MDIRPHMRSQCEWICQSSPLSTTTTRAHIRPHMRPHEQPSVNRRSRSSSCLTSDEITPKVLPRARRHGEPPREPPNTPLLSRHQRPRAYPSRVALLLSTTPSPQRRDMKNKVAKQQGTGGSSAMMKTSVGSSSRPGGKSSFPISSSNPSSPQRIRPLNKVA